MRIACERPPWIRLNKPGGSFRKTGESGLHFAPGSNGQTTGLVGIGTAGTAETATESFVSPEKLTWPTEPSMSFVWVQSQDPTIWITSVEIGHVLTLSTLSQLSRSKTSTADAAD